MNYDPPFLHYFLAHPLKTTVFAMGGVVAMAVGQTASLKAVYWLLVIGLQPLLLSMSLSTLSGQNKLLYESTPNADKAYLLGVAIPYRASVLRNVYFFSADMMRQWMSRQARLRCMVYLIGLILAVLDIIKNARAWSNASDTVLIMLELMLAGYYIWRSRTYYQLWKMADRQQWQECAALMGAQDTSVISAYLPARSSDDKNAPLPFLAALLDPDVLKLG
jgi:hypothetical protein